MVLMEHPVHGRWEFPAAKVEQIKLNGWAVVGEPPKAIEPKAPEHKHVGTLHLPKPGAKKK